MEVEQASHLVRDPQFGSSGPLSDWPLQRHSSFRLIVSNYSMFPSEGGSRIYRRLIY